MFIEGIIYVKCSVKSLIGIKCLISHGKWFLSPNESHSETSQKCVNLSVLPTQGQWDKTGPDMVLFRWKCSCPTGCLRKQAHPAAPSPSQKLKGKCIHSQALSFQFALIRNLLLVSIRANGIMQQTCWPSSPAHRSPLSSGSHLQTTLSLPWWGHSPTPSDNLQNLPLWLLNLRTCHPSHIPPSSCKFFSLFCVLVFCVKRG